MQRRRQTNELRFEAVLGSRVSSRQQCLGRLALYVRVDMTGPAQLLVTEIQQVDNYITSMHVQLVENCTTLVETHVRGVRSGSLSTHGTADLLAAGISDCRSASAICKPDTSGACKLLTSACKICTADFLKSAWI